MKTAIKTGVLVASCFTSLAASAIENSPDKGPLTSLLINHTTALKNQDINAALDSFGPGTEIVLLGTGPGERWIGKEQITEAYQHYFADYDKGSMNVDCDWQTSETRDQLAWLTAVCAFTDTLKGEKRDYTVHLSGIAEKHDEKWGFRTLHASNITHKEAKEE